MKSTTVLFWIAVAHAVLTWLPGCKHTTREQSELLALRPGGAIEDLSSYVVRKPDDLLGLRQELAAIHPEDVLFDRELPDWVAPATRRASNRADIFFVQQGLSAISRVAIKSLEQSLSEKIYKTNLHPDALIKIFMLPLPVAAREILRLDGVTYTDDQIVSDRDVNFAISSLTVAELICIKDFTTSGFGLLNRSLRNEDPKEARRFIHIARCLASGINKLPHYQGPVVRGDRTLPVAEISRYEKGTEKEEGQFLSATVGNEVLEQFRGSVETRIQSLNGRRISVLSEMPGENEVVFPPGSRYKILNTPRKTTTTDGESVLVIELQQTK